MAGCKNLKSPKIFRYVSRDYVIRHYIIKYYVICERNNKKKCAHTKSSVDA